MSEEMNNIEVNDYGVGDLVTGVVSQVEEKQVVVGIEGSKLDGIIPISELSSLHIESANDVVSENDTLELEVIKVEETALILSKRKVDASKSWDDLQEKYDNNEVFEATVNDIVKGGLVVDLGVRGFVPASLVEPYYVEDFSDYKDKTLAFKIVELDREKNRLILSHRIVVEEEQKQERQKLLENLEEGQVLEGKVQRLTDFGAFVDIGGVDGLVHISELSHEHVEKPSDVVEEGQDVKVKILSVSVESERISLSIKETKPGPWELIEEKAPVGTVLEGVIKRLVDFGAFVEVAPGVEGLVHISQISHDHVEKAEDVLTVGDTVNVKVIDANIADRRLSLSIKELIEKEEEEAFSYETSEEQSGFQLGEVIGDQLKKLK